MRRIRIGLDGSRASGHALQWAAEMARTHGAVLEIATVVVPHGRPLETLMDRPPDRSPADEVLDRQRAVVEELLDDTAGLHVDHVALLGHPVERLVASEPEPDLLVVGTRGVGGFVGLIVGSTAHQVIEHAPCDVVVVPDTVEPPRVPARIVVGTDGTTVARHAVAWAAREAQLRDASLHVVTAYRTAMTTPEPLLAPSVIYEPGQQRKAAEALAIEALSQLPTEQLRATWGAEDGRADLVLMERCEQADLLVIGAPGIGSIGPMHLGSVAHRCLKRAPVPVALVR